MSSGESSYVARSSILRAGESSPNHRLQLNGTYFDLGMCRLAERRPTEALDLFFCAEAAGADPDACAAQRWFCWMLLGEFENAWREGDAIAIRNASVANCSWDGSPFTGRRVMVRSLHGFGDAIQFLRYLPLLKHRAAGVILETHPDLVCLTREQSFVESAISWNDKEEAAQSRWDQQIEVMEFPRAFGTNLRTIPADIPYLQVPAGAIERVLFYMEKSPFVRDRNREPRVGLVWGAGDWDSSRSLPVRHLAQILRVPGVAFFSFQHGRHRGDLSRLREIGPIQDTACFCNTILETAAALMQMDLLITVDTMAAHLAGALGLPVWTLLQWRADWRWMLGREDSPWYPTMRLFRQDESREWGQPVAAVAAELQRLPVISSQR